MILLRQRTFTLPLATQLALRNTARPGAAEAAVSRLTRTASSSNMKPDLTTIIKRKFPAKVVPSSSRAGLGPISTAAKQATPPSKAVNMAKSAFKPSVTTTKPIAGFNPTMTFM